MELATAIVIAEQLVNAAEKLSDYWDETGLDMHIAVKPRTIAVSTKHWSRVHYLSTNGMTPKEVWEELKKLATEIKRKLVLSTKGPYVYVPKLNI